MTVFVRAVHRKHTLQENMSSHWTLSRILRVQPPSSEHLAEIANNIQLRLSQPQQNLFSKGNLRLFGTKEQLENALILHVFKSNEIFNAARVENNFISERGNFHLAIPLRIIWMRLTAPTVLATSILGIPPV